MQMFYEDEQVSMFAPDSCVGEWCDTFLTEKVRRKNERMVKKHLQN